MKSLKQMALHIGRISQPARIPRAVMLFFGTVLVLSSWSLASPPMGTPDEASHLVYAQGVWRADFDSPFMVPSVPESRISCYVFNSLQDAGCAAGAWGDDIYLHESSAEAYPPIYYVLVGWGHLFADGEMRGYAVRWASVALASLVIAVSVSRYWTAAVGDRPNFGSDVGGRKTNGQGFHRLGILVLSFAAIPPATAMYLSSVNPSSFSYASAFSFYMTLGAIRLRSEANWRDLAALSLYSTVFLLVRRDSVFWVTVMAVAFVLLAARPVLKALRLKPLFVLIFLPALLAFLYQLFGGAGELAQGVWAAGDASNISGGWAEFIMSKLPVASWISTQVPSYFQQLLGTFGWLDTSLPTGLSFLMTLLYGSLIIQGLLAPRPSPRIALVGITAFIVGPIILLTLGGSPHYQGRYAIVCLPLMLSAIVIAPERDTIVLGDILRRLSPTSLGLLLFTSHFVSLWQFIRRNSIGLGGSWSIFSQRNWTPLFGVTAPILLLALGAGALVYAAVKSDSLGRSLG